MSHDRWADVRIERAAVLAVERSVLEHTDLVTAAPSADFGIDLLAFRTKPFGVVPIQVKGAGSGMTVWGKHAQAPIIIAYVIDPLSDSPNVCIMTGAEAWSLPFEYIEQGGRAEGHDLGNKSYRWSSLTRLLRTMLEERKATPQRWDNLFEEVRAR